MATDQQLLDILLQIRASGLAEADAVNKVLAQTDTTASGLAVQVNALSDAHGKHAKAAGAAAAAERDVTAEASAAARAMGALGEQGAHAFDRLSALGGVMGSSGALGLGIGAALVGGGAVIEMGKSMIENADKNEEAQKGLGQAFDTQGKNLRDFQGQIDAWIKENSSFIKSQYDAKDGFATLTRAGFDWNETQRLMNIALDLSVNKNVSLAQATDDLVRARSGDARALRDLGIAQKDIEDPTKELASAQKDVAKATQQQEAAARSLDEWETAHAGKNLTAADLLREQDLKGKAAGATKNLQDADAKLADAQAAVADKGDKFQVMLDILRGRLQGSRDSVSDLHQQSNRLNYEWQRLSNENGPALEGMLADVAGGAATAAEKMGDPSMWKGINDALVGSAKELKNFGDEAVVTGDHFGYATESVRGHEVVIRDKLIPAFHEEQERAEAARGQIDLLAQSRHADAEHADAQARAQAPLTDALDRARDTLLKLKVQDDDTRESFIKQDVVTHTLAEHLDADKGTWRDYLTTLQDAGAFAHTDAEHQDEQAAAIKRARDAASDAYQPFADLDRVISHLQGEHTVNVNTDYSSSGTPPDLGGGSGDSGGGSGSVPAGAMRFAAGMSQVIVGPGSGPPGSTFISELPKLGTTLITGDVLHPHAQEIGDVLHPSMVPEIGPAVLPPSMVPRIGVGIGPGVASGGGGGALGSDTFGSHYGPLWRPGERDKLDNQLEELAEIKDGVFEMVTLLEQLVQHASGTAPGSTIGANSPAALAGLNSAIARFSEAAYFARRSGFRTL